MAEIQADERSAAKTERRMQFGVLRALQMPAKPNELVTSNAKAEKRA